MLEMMFIAFITTAIAFIALSVKDLLVLTPERVGVEK